MKLMNIRFLLACAYLAAVISASSCSPAKSPEAWTTSSPSGTLAITVSIDSGKLHYYVLLEKDTVIRRSELGVEFAGESFSSDLAFVSSKDSAIDERYTMVTGKRKDNHAKANQTILEFVNGNGHAIQVIARAYDEGVAFRYFFPGIDSAITVTRESTSFAVPVSGKAWIQSYSLPASWKPSYEEYYSNGSPVGEPAIDTSGYSLAALFENEGKWVLLTEAGLDDTYFGAHLAQNCDGGIYRIQVPQLGEANNMYSNLASATQPFATPWRTIIVAGSLAGIVESNLVHHLAAPQIPGDMSWVKPGKSSWSWWSDFASSKDFNKLVRFVDLSNSMGWDYSLVDANWDIMTGGNIEQLIAHAKKQGVGLTLWYNSSGPHCTITERPRDIMNDPVKRKEEFKKLRSWGVRAVKVDFFNSDKQEIIKLYLDILKDAAAEQIMVVFHGSTLPRGWSRTYPNLLSMESVRGAEYYGNDTSMIRRSATHNTIISFSRNVVGPMDYTPVTFGSHACCPHPTSNAHELALAVLFESGVLHFADHAREYLALPDDIKTFMRELPTTWDDTKFIEGYPGKEIVLARQKENKWYVAGVNGEPREKMVSADLSFLPEGEYDLLILRDGADNRKIETEKITYRSGSPLEIKLLPYGGFAIEIKR